MNYLYFLLQSPAIMEMDGTKKLPNDYKNLHMPTPATKEANLGDVVYAIPIRGKTLCCLR